MILLNENFVVNKEGHKIGVFLDIESYTKLLEELEELDEIRAYDAAKASNDNSLSFDQAVIKIEQDRRDDL